MDGSKATFTTDSDLEADDAIGDLELLDFSHEGYARQRSSTMDSFTAPCEDDGIAVPLDPPGVWFRWRTLWAYTGPGILMSIAFLDPGNLEADLQAGAYTGYQLIWVLFLATSLGVLMQCLAAKVGVVTGRHMAELCSQEYPRWVSLPLWAMVEVAVIGSDIQEVMGTALALALLFGLPLWVGCVITVADAFLFLGLKGFGIRPLEAFFMSMVGLMSATFLLNFARDAPPAGELLAGFAPLLRPYAAPTAVGVLGAVVMPHNLFLHSALVLTRGLDRRDQDQVRQALKYTYLDSAISLFISFVINLAVIGSFAYNFYSPTCARASTMSACVNHPLDGIEPSQLYGDCTNTLGAGQCMEVGLSQAGDVLGRTLGATAKALWAVGLLASGQSSTMTGAYAGQFVFEGFLRIPIPRWLSVLVTRCVALVPALLVAVGSMSNPVLSDVLQQWLNILQSIQLPFALFPLLFFLASPKIMGQFAVSRIMWWALAGIIATLLGMNLYITQTSLPDTSGLKADLTWGLSAALAALAALYLYVIAALTYFLWRGTGKGRHVAVAPGPSRGAGSFRHPGSWQQQQRAGSARRSRGASDDRRRARGASGEGRGRRTPPPPPPPQHSKGGEGGGKYGALR